ncbi:MAG: segregation/condensation protein A [Sphingobacteriaceae bacterium]|nr:segregation/condensation protein A [Sphingobacteriaceae bacterium]
MSFEIKLQQFEGPFDLLLFFIERDELDIYDIPISDITRDFLSYIQDLSELNMEVASEFILVAATLMRIKAKMLLPRKELDESGNEIDPRTDLVNRLLEYKRYKAVLNSMAELEEQQLGRVRRGNVEEELAAIQANLGVEQELEQLDLYQLLKSFSKVLQRFEERESAPRHVVVRYPYTIDEQKAYVVSAVKVKGKLAFEQLFTGFKDRMQAIFTFLAILELLQLQLLDIKMGEGYNSFFLLDKKEAA